MANRSTVTFPCSSCAAPVTVYSVLLDPVFLRGTSELTGRVQCSRGHVIEPSTLAKLHSAINRPRPVVPDAIPA
jgi:hypothetical protein